MPTEVLIATNPSLSAIIWADSTDFAPTSGQANDWGARTNQLDLTSLAAGAYRQGEKVDLGADDIAVMYAIVAAIEFDVAPTARRTVELYFAFSNSATAAQANPANLSGADGAYTGYSSDPDVSIFQLGPPQGIMSVAARVAPTFQVAQCGLLVPRDRYVIPVVRNNTDQALEGDAIEMFVGLFPLTPESQ